MVADRELFRSQAYEAGLMLLIKLNWRIFMTSPAAAATFAASHRFRDVPENRGLGSPLDTVATSFHIRGAVQPILVLRFVTTFQMYL